MNQFTDYQLEVLEKATVDCLDIVRLMGDYHDRELPRTLHGRIHSHIKNCKVCSEMYAGYSLVVQLAGELRQDQQMSSDAKARLRNRLNERLGIQL